MTTYNTKNPVGSTDARDLYDNAENLDAAMNGPQDHFTDRLGVQRRTFRWFEATAEQKLQELSTYKPTGDLSSTRIYNRRDVAITGGIAYAALTDGLNGATFAADFAAGKWVVFQGVTKEQVEEMLADAKKSRNLDFTGGAEWVNPDEETHSLIDIANYQGQSNPATAKAPVVIHDYADASRTTQLDKVGGNIALGGYVLGLRRASNHIRRPDKPGTYVSEAGFLRASYDKFAETCVFTGYIAGNTLTVTAITSGTLVSGQFLLWDASDNGTTITGQTGGAPGGVGVYSLAIRGSTSAGQIVAETTITAKTKSEVLAWYVGQKGDFGWSTDQANFTTGYSGGLYAYNFKATASVQYVAAWESANGQVLALQDAVGGTRTDIISPAGQISGIRIEALGGGIDLAPKTGSNVTVRGSIVSASGSDLQITAFGSKLKLGASNGVESAAPIRPGLYNSASLPDPAQYLGFSAFVSNGNSGAPCLAVSNGTSWLRVPLGAAVSAT